MSTAYGFAVWVDEATKMLLLTAAEQASLTPAELIADLIYREMGARLHWPGIYGKAMQTTYRDYLDSVVRTTYP